VSHSRPHTQHINRLFSEPPTYNTGKTVITSVNWILQTKHTEYDNLYSPSHGSKQQ